MCAHSYLVVKVFLLSADFVDSFVVVHPLKLLTMWRAVNRAHHGSSVATPFCSLYMLNFSFCGL